MTDNWTDRLAGARMQVDQQFQRRVDSSEFTNQQWGLVMTAVEFDIENAEDPDRARLVADTDHLSAIVPELDEIQRQMGQAAGQQRSSPSNEGGLLGRFRKLFGGDGSGGADASDEEQLSNAEVLVEEYTRELQRHLEEQGRWEEIRNAAAES